MNAKTKTKSRTLPALPPKRLLGPVADASWINAPDIGRLLSLLALARPHDSVTEQAAVEHFLLGPYKAETFGPMQNVCVMVGNEPKTLFSCHTDTVHHSQGAQKLAVDVETNRLVVQDGDCLGADDGAGMWLMLQMIDAGVPGAYLFHRGEECGCVGSRWMANNMDIWLSQFSHAVAFDRRGTGSIITHQCGERCCSDEFADALGEALGMGHMPDDTGSYTDTAQYTHLIPECTNVSCGYYSEHRPDESLDVTYLVKLAEALKKVDWNSLPTVRNPDEIYDAENLQYLEDLEGADYGTLMQICQEYPEVVASLIEDHFRAARFGWPSFKSKDESEALC